MKKLTFTAVIFFIFFCGNAQEKFGFVEYQIVKNIDVKIKKTGQLFFTKDYSYFVEKNLNLDSLNQNLPERIRRLFPNTERNLSGSDEEFCFFDIINNKLLFSEFVVDELYTIKENKRFKWQIQKETKQIGNFSCRKAIGDFRGRKYIAWYTEDYGVSYGPWKSNGLPGLIIELFDEDKLIHFHANYVTNKLNLDKMPEHRKDINEKKVLSIKEFSKIRKDKYYGLVSKIQSKLPRSSGNVKMVGYDEKIQN